MKLLTEEQWRVLCNAIALADAEWDDGTNAMSRREKATLDRALDKIREQFAPVRWRL